MDPLFINKLGSNNPADEFRCKKSDSKAKPHLGSPGGATGLTVFIFSLNAIKVLSP